MKTAIITGVAGQDGSYLSELLLSKGYRVVGVTRKKNTGENFANISSIIDNPKFQLVEGDLSDYVLISRLLIDYRPHEFYNLGAQSHVGNSFKNPLEAFRVNGEAVMMHLSNIRSLSPYTRYYQASTSEILGGVNCPSTGYDESFIPNPRSPYAIAKMTAHYTVKNFREAYSLYAVSGILFNHSSTRRGLSFATRKITNGVSKIKLGLQKNLFMGNLDAFRDEGCSKDYVEAMWMMLNQDIIANKKPEDYVVSTGNGDTIKGMLQYVCQVAELDFDDVYRLDERFLRPSDVPYLLGNSSKIRKELGWNPKYSLETLLKEMYYFDLNKNKENL